MRKIKFITGPAGTGKSHTLRQLIQEETKPNLICAPSGMAAVAVGGATLHRTFKINVDSGFVGKRWNDIETVYIDEASMMGAKLFEAALAGAPNADFVLVGDMAQLPPVKDRFWFESSYLKGYEIQIERLTKQWRQKDDEKYTEVLNGIRDGSAHREELRWMYANSCHPDDNIRAVTLAFRNDTVRAINAEKLLEIEGDVYEYEAEYGGAMKVHDCIAESLLILKKGAEVIMLTNQKDGYWFNGSRARVVSVSADEVQIIVAGSTTKYTVSQHNWQMKVPQEVTPLRRSELEDDLRRGIKVNLEEIRHWLMTGIEYVTIGTCKQLPMKLAYSMTVHKAQGMTLDSAHIITSGFAGCHGIGYVAVSRVRSLDTISFDRKPVPSDFKFNQKLIEYI